MYYRQNLVSYWFSSQEAISAIPGGIIDTLALGAYSGRRSIDLDDVDTWPESWDGTPFGSTNPALNCAVYFGLSPAKVAHLIWKFRLRKSATLDEMDWLQEIPQAAQRAILDISRRL